MANTILISNLMQFRNLLHLLVITNENSFTFIFQFSKCKDTLSKMCVIYSVEVDEVPEYSVYFDISLIPATIFFFNSQHIKVDWE